MKSIFKGLSARLALALLVVSSAMITGCYEKEDGDVPTPPNYPDPVYFITGNITEYSTGKALDGVSVNVSTAGSATTDSNGDYEIKSNSAAGSATVTFTKSGYTTVTKNLTIATIGQGEAAVYTVSATMVPEGYESKLLVNEEIENDYGKSTKVFTSSDTEEVDVINNTNTPLKVDFNIAYDNGAAYVDNNQLDNISNNFKTEIESYLKAEFGGTDITTQFQPKNYPYSITVQPMQALQSVTATTYYNKVTYTFSLDNERTDVEVYVAYRTEADNAQVASGHSHGNGHGHGGNLNAGGGIIEPLS